jgi:hypothetical protein
MKEFGIGVIRHRLIVNWVTSYLIIITMPSTVFQLSLLSAFLSIMVHKVPFHASSSHTVAQTFSNGPPLVPEFRVVAAACVKYKVGFLRP